MSNRTPLRNPCLDCGSYTWNLHGKSEWYMVHDRIWQEAGAPTRPVMDRRTPGFYLCIGCLETRIGRHLTPADFPDYPVNDPSPLNTDRLNDRLTP